MRTLMLITIGVTIAAVITAIVVIGLILVDTIKESRENKSLALFATITAFIELALISLFVGIASTFYTIF